MPDWLDFNWIKDNASFETICHRYKVALQGTGDQRKAHCPFHNDRRPSLQVNLDKRVFHCFGCNVSGNILDFVMRLEECGIREAAKFVVEICQLAPPAAPADEHKKSPARLPKVAKATKPSSPLPKAVDVAGKRNAPKHGNPVLTFRLNLDLNAAMPYLECRDVDRETAEEFGLGVASRGMMTGRLCIPIHDAAGNLVAYAGRYMGIVPDDAEKYLLPPKFTKTLELFNLHRALPLAANYLVVVEGYFGAIRLHRLGYPTVAVMGSSISPEQVAAIEATGRTPFVMTDGDEAGRKAAEKITCALACRIATRLIDLPDGEEPDTVSKEFLRENLPRPIS
jgi:DNA primase